MVETQAGTTYRAVLCHRLDGPGALAIEQVPRPPLGPEEVRIRVAAAGVHFPDLLMVQGLYQHKPLLPFVPGMELAGEVIEAPPGSGLQAGDRVMAHLRSGAWAEEAVVPLAQISRLPTAFGYAEGAAFYAAGITAYHALATRARLGAGQTLLVLGASGGVGLASVQLGAVFGARVIAAASSPEKLAWAARYGAANGINYATRRLEDAVRDLTGGHGVDVVLDPVGIAPEQALRCVTWGGRVLVVGFAGGSIPSYAGNRVLLKGACVVGVRAGEYGRRFPAERAAEMTALTGYAERGEMRPVVSDMLPLAEAALALERLATRQVVGRIVLTTDAYAGGPIAANRAVEAERPP